MYEIEPLKPYDKSDLNYDNENSKIYDQIHNKKYVAIKRIEIDLEKYDRIYIGFPIHWGDLPRTIAYFGNQYDFTNVEIIPFATSKRSRIYVAQASIRENFNSKKIYEGKRFSADVDEKKLKERLFLLDKRKISH